SPGSREWFKDMLS
nr:Chain P, AB5 PEPTIDE [synthetic construct]2JF9_Q Chain Q, AB5 PEPTIDE [synthetic construct]2JF9_R Chain R, AB5 PEPTIDE [synthetic construct]